MVAFAVGSLLDDTFFHLLFEIFLGEDSPEHVRFVMVGPNKNLVLGLAIMVGFITFVAINKALRIAIRGESGHDNSHSPSHAEAPASARSSGSNRLATNGELKKRGSIKKSNGSLSKPLPPPPPTKINPNVKFGGYLNLIADFTHNVIDGLTLSSSFYASPTINTTTTVAVFFHEIPHEIGDFMLLIQSNFFKWKAMGAQFVTAVGAF